MLHFVLLLRAVTSGFALGDTYCGCTGKCSNPVLDWKADCPAYGYDCQRTHAALGLFRKHVHEDYVTIKCADDKASLFVKRKSQEKLKCSKKSGGWMINNECKSVESALCALPCTTCSTRVPNFLTVDATSISVLSANSERPCSIGFCDGDGFTLLGIDAGNVPTVVYGNVTCTGNGWMDDAGRIYSHAVCQYYACATLSIAAPSADTVPLVSSGSRSFSCPPGSFLTYNSPYAIFQTQYSLTCGPNNTWQLYGLDWDASNFASVTCTPYKPCTTTISPLESCVGSDVCTPPTQTTVAYGTATVSLLTCPDPNYILLAKTSTGEITSTNPVTGNRYICSGDAIIDILNGHLGLGTFETTNLSCVKSQTCSDSLTNIGSTVCQADPEHCTEATVTTSSISCPPGSTLVYTQAADTYNVSIGNLTCFSNAYYDSGAFQSSKITPVSGATCTTKTNLACPQPPNVFAPDGISFEIPPDNDHFGPSVPQLTFVDGQWLMFIDHGDHDDGIIYYNNNFSIGTRKLQCGNDGMWHTLNNITVTTATFLDTKCGSPPPYPVGSNPLQPAATAMECVNVVYQLPGENVQHTFTSDEYGTYCAPNGQLALHINDGDVDYFIPPPGTLIGCLDGV